MVPRTAWFIIARYLGEEALLLALVIRDADEELGDAVYQIAEDHHLAALEA